MPIVKIFGEDVRCQPVLAAIAAQEALEAAGRQRPPPMHGPRAMAMWERERTAAARRRNRAEAALRPGEHAAWDRWRGSDPATRAAAFSMLVDPPCPVNA